LKINSEKSSGKNDACEISNTDFTPGSEIELINSEYQGIRRSAGAGRTRPDRPLSLAGDRAIS